MRTIICIAITAAATLGVAPVASAGQPAVRGCMGETISSAAHALAPWGQFVAPLAQNGEISTDVHTLQAGAFTDEEFPNGCN